MSNFSPMKPRTPGTIWSAISRAMDQLGGADAMATAVNRKPWWAYTVSDEDAAANARTNLSYADACALAEKGGTALAEHIALKAGGVFIPGGVIDEATLQAHVAAFSVESGEAVGEIIRRAADPDGFCPSDAAAALSRVKDALRPLLALYHHCVALSGKR
jgi:hypothetical protein